MIINKELIHKLAEAFDSIELTPDEVDASLREAGYDPDEVGAKMKAIADKTLIRVKILKEQTGKPDWDRVIATCDKAVPGNDIAVIVKLRDGKCVSYGKIENNDDLLRFIENIKGENHEPTRAY